jgi:hypothetical protein
MRCFEISIAMRTTLDLDEDILLAAKELARQQRVAAGTVISRLVRQALSGQVAGSSEGSESSVAGFRPFAARGRVVSNAQVDVLRDQEGV